MIALPQHAQRPVPAGIQIEGIFGRAGLGGHLGFAFGVRQVVVGGHDVAAKQHAALEALQEVDHVRAIMLGHLSHDPLGGTGIEMQVGVSIKQTRQEGQILRPATEVCGDPWHLKAVEQALERHVVRLFRAVHGGVAIARGEPGVRIGHVRHERHAKARCQLHRRHAFRRVQSQGGWIAQLDREIHDARCRPELADACAKRVIGLDALQESRAMRVTAILRCEVRHGDQLQSITHHVAYGGHLLERRHGPDAVDAIQIHGLAQQHRGPGAVHVRVRIDDAVRQAREALRFLAIVHVEQVRRIAWHGRMVDGVQRACFFSGRFGPAFLPIARETVRTTAGAVSSLPAWCTPATYIS